MWTIDGSTGEGGGQVLRTSLALALALREPVRVFAIRAGRPKPGLMRQHLTALQAAITVSRGSADGAFVGSTDITFRPGDARGGDYRFSVGTAGSATLVLQTILPALLTASTRTSLVLEGGTHNPQSPPFDFLARAFLPLLNRLGPRVEARLEQPGFYPAGGGRIQVQVEPSPKLDGLELLERGELRSQSARALVAHLPRSIADRELQIIGQRLGWDESRLRSELVSAAGPGNVVMIEIESEHVSEVFTGFGTRGLPAESVAEGVANEALEYLHAGVPVASHLADQLLPILALAGGGAFRSLPPSSHARTQADLLRRLLGVETRMLPLSDRVWLFELTRGARG